MITSSELIDIVYEHLEPSPLMAAVSGGLYIRSRPQDSEVEDIVINALPVTNEAVSNAILNVNVFVPDFLINNAGTHQRQPNNARIKQLEKLARSVLVDMDVAYDDQHVMYDIQQMFVIKDNESEQHYINIRLEFFTTNI